MKLAYEVRDLMNNYSQGSIDAQELLAGILAYDENYLKDNALLVKHGLENSLLTRGSMTPQERVRDKAAFFEAYYDYALGIAG